MKTKSFSTSIWKRALLVLVVSLGSQSAIADTYKDWHDEISAASQGLDVCIDSHSESLRGDISEKARIKRVQEAKQACGTLRRVFDNTLLAARSRVTGMDVPLARFHKAILDTFDYVVPERREQPLDYALRAEETKLARLRYLSVLQQHGQLSSR